jgi:riboflavin-specific deaminase-like protein
VALNMISTADGRATLSGRSGAIGGEADRQLFHGLRTVVDAVMAGAGTLRAERYGRIVRDPAAREARRERGLDEEPLACIVSGRLALDKKIPLLSDPGARVAIVTASEASLSAACRAQIEYVRCVREGELDLAAAMRELRGRFGVRTLLCEGGPHLNAHLLAAGLVDELFLSLAPTLAGGDAGSQSLRIVTGLDLDPPVAMELVSAHEDCSHLFLRYRLAR